MLKLVVSLILSVCTFVAQAVNSVSIKQETPIYVIDIKYPQGFKNVHVNTVLHEFIEKTKKGFFKEIAQDKDVPADAPGKSGLYVTYSIPYQTKNALSIQFAISINHHGAAHPFNSVSVLNFINGTQVQLSDLFRSGVDYLTPIATFSSKQISAKNISDKNWVAEGTDPIEKNYQKWSFTAKGINVIFDTYQVAAYVYGPQSVMIPLSQIASFLKPAVAHKVWGR